MENPKVKLNKAVPGQVARWVRAYHLEINIYIYIY